jgi:raffinose/stachyose/melibiose transport system permease protein
MFRYGPRTLMREVTLWVVALIGLIPFYFLVVIALKSPEEVNTTPLVALPERPTLDNFVAVATVSGDSNVLRGLAVSVTITFATILLLVALGSVTGYVIARRTSRWSRLAYYTFLVAIILPSQLALVPLYVGARQIGLTGSIPGMVVVYTGLFVPLATFLYAGFFRGLGTEYEEAALIDGATRGQIFRRIVLPLMAPATGTVAIMTGLIVWNDFFISLIFLGGSDVQTLPVSMYYYVGSLVSQWNEIFAIVIISMLPILTFYLLAQKHFIRGFAGGLKG